MDVFFDMFKFCGLIFEWYNGVWLDRSILDYVVCSIFLVVNGISGE